MKLLKSELLWLILLLTLSFCLRLYRFNNPIADWHSWRQADTSSMTRNFVKEGFTPLLPKFDTYNSLNEFGLENPERYFLAEFPLYNIITYFSYIGIGYFTIEQWGRLVSIIASTGTVLVLYLLVKEYSSKYVALVAAFFYSVLPYNIYYGRVILSDPLHIFLSVSSLLFLTFWLKQPNKKISWLYCLASGICYAGALLTKPYALVLLIPILYLILRRYKLSFYRQIPLFLFLLTSLLPFLLWRNHIAMYPEGQFGTTWLFNQGNIRFTGAFFRWLIFDRMNRLIFATGGFVLLWLGIAKGITKKEGMFYYMWLLSILIFFTIIAKGNVTHDYYQMPLVPIGCIFMAKGVEFLLSRGTGIMHKIFNASLVIILVLLTLAFGWFEVRDYFNINHPEIVLAGKTVDKLLPIDAKVIAPYDNDPAFLYQTNRHGWTFGGDKIEKYRTEGATHLVSVNFDDTTNYWMGKCSIVVKQKEFVIIDLKRCQM